MFKNPLSQLIFDAVKTPLHLIEDSQYSDLNTITTLDGSVIGSIHVFKGKRLEKMVISEFFTGPGMPASLVVIKPELSYDVPRFGSDFSQRGERLHLDMDLFPHKDLASDHNYFQHYYSPLEITYLAACKKYQSRQPSGLWLRNYISPYFFMAEADTKQQPELQNLGLEYANNWLSIWAAQDQTTSITNQQILRADSFEQLSMQHNPVRSLFNKLLGEDLATRALKTLY